MRVLLRAIILILVVFLIGGCFPTHRLVNHLYLPPETYSGINHGRKCSITVILGNTGKYTNETETFLVHMWGNTGLQCEVSLLKQFQICAGASDGGAYAHLLLTPIVNLWGIYPFLEVGYSATSVVDQYPSYPYFGLQIARSFDNTDAFLSFTRFYPGVKQEYENLEEESVEWRRYHKGEANSLTLGICHNIGRSAGVGGSISFITVPDGIYELGGDSVSLRDYDFKCFKTHFFVTWRF